MKSNLPRKIPTQSLAPNYGEHQIYPSLRNETYEALRGIDIKVNALKTENYKTQGTVTLSRSC